MRERSPRRLIIYLLRREKSLQEKGRNKDVGFPAMLIHLGLGNVGLKCLGLHHPIGSLLLCGLPA